MLKFTALIIILLLNIFDVFGEEGENEQNKIYVSHDTWSNWRGIGKGTVSTWPDKFLDNTVDEYTAENLAGWFCATENTRFKSKNAETSSRFKRTMPKNIMMAADDDEDTNVSVTIWKNSNNEPFFKIKAKTNIERILIPLQFLVDRDKKEFEEKRQSFFDPFDNAKRDKSCNEDDIKNDVVKTNLDKFVPACIGISSDLYPDYLESIFSCTAAGNPDILLQPKQIPDSFAASSAKGILAMGYVVPFPTKSECKMQKTILLLPLSEYKLLVHKDDVENPTHELDDCLNIFYNENTSTKPPPTTTLTPPKTTTTVPITTTTTAPITSTTTIATTKITTTRTTKWKLVTNQIEFLAGPTSFPEDAEVIL